MPRGRRQSTEPTARNEGGRYYMISVVSKVYGIHPQTLRLYEREGLLKPSRTEGNTRLYSEEDLRQLEVILNLTRDLGVNLAGVEIVLNMRRRMAQMQTEVNDFVGWVRQELSRAAQDGWQERLQQALVKLPPTPLARAVYPGAAVDAATRSQASVVDDEGAEGDSDEASPQRSLAVGPSLKRP